VHHVSAGPHTEETEAVTRVDGLAVLVEAIVTSKAEHISVSTVAFIQGFLEYAFTNGHTAGEVGHEAHGQHVHIAHLAGMAIAGNPLSPAIEDMPEFDEVRIVDLCAFVQKWTQPNLLQINVL